MIAPTLALMLLAAAPQAAAPPTAAPPTADDARALAAARGLGTMLYRLDRAAWVASDAATAAIPRDQLAGDGGWVIERASEEALIVTFYRGTADAAQAFFTATVREGKVVASGSTPPTPLTAPQQRLARARAAALAAATAKGYAPCTPRPFNTVVVPSPDQGGPVLVYLLTPQVTNGTWPLGGHYRFVVDAGGKVVSQRAFSRACLNLQIPKLPAGAKPVGMFVSHLLDRTPTELHVFTSYSARMPLFVGAGGQVWDVTGGKIAVSKMKMPPPPGAPGS